MRKESVKKKIKNFLQASANSFDSLLAGFTDALEENSGEIVKALKQLKKKKLTTKDKKILENIGKEIKSLNKDLDTIDNFTDTDFGGFDGF